MSFNAAEAAYVATGSANGSTTSELVRGTKSELFPITVKRMRPGYRAAFIAWLATYPATNRNAPADPSEMPQYRLPQETYGLALKPWVRRADQSGKVQTNKEGSTHIHFGPTP